jgi:hypothetical protein
MDSPLSAPPLNADDNRLIMRFSNRGIEVKPPISFFVRLGAVSSPRPEAYVAPRAAAVNDGRRRSPQAARSVIDGSEPGADPEVGRSRLRHVASMFASLKAIVPSACRWPAEVMVLSEVDTGSPHHGFRGAATPQCEDANCSAMIVPANSKPTPNTAARSDRRSAGHASPVALSFYDWREAL